MSTPFSSIDLSGISNSSILGFGVHKVKIAAANYDPNAGTLELELSSATGSLKDVLRLQADNEVGQRISRQRLKSYLVATGHPDPDHPDDVNWFTNKTVQVRVEPGKSYRRDDGSTGQYKNITGVFSPEAEVPEPRPRPAEAASPFTPPSNNNFDDAIPF